MKRFGCVLALGGVFFGGLAPMAASEPVNFGKDIWPIFQDRCVSCHGESKQKGDLRLDSRAAIEKGGHDGPIYVAGKPEESSLVKLISLPKGHEDIMPAKGDPLKEEEIAAIRRWVEEGAQFGEWTAPTATAGANATAESAVKTAAPASGPDPEVARYAALGQGLSAPSQEAIDAVRAAGALALPLFQDTPLLRVDFHLAGDRVTDEQLKLLVPLANNIVWLNLANTKITDAGLAQISCLSNLTRLHLEKTGITDAGLDHLAGFSQLEYLNLYGTGVSDAGIAKLAGLPRLSRLYAWQTGVTPAGASALKAKLAKLTVNLGAELADAAAAAAAPDTEKVALRVKADGVYLGEEKLEEAVLVDRIRAEVAKHGGGVVVNSTPDAPVSLLVKALSAVEAAGVATAEVATETGAEKTAEAEAPAAAAPEVALAAQYDPEGCCGKAGAEGKECDHPCCAEARAKGTACAKCNPGAERFVQLAKLFEKDACCAGALAQGKRCNHPCCVEAAVKGEVCRKCNPNAGAPAAESAAAEPLAALFDKDSCCAKAAGERRECDHPCCAEARQAGKVCTKCNPGAAPKQEAAAKPRYDENSCCAVAVAANKDCDHPCCVAARQAGKVCGQCNPGAA